MGNKKKSKETKNILQTIQILTLYDSYLKDKTKLYLYPMVGKRNRCFVDFYSHILLSLFVVGPHQPFG